MNAITARDLEAERAVAADRSYIDADFGEVRVEADNGWEIDGDRWTKAVFMDVGADESVKMIFAIDFITGQSELTGEPEFTLPDLVAHAADETPIYGYYVNLDERGEFCSDVRSVEGRTVFEITGDTLTEALEGGFLKHKDDIAGLQVYLSDVTIIEGDARIMTSADFEKALESRSATPSP